jgi:hypothetical protein
MSLAKILVLVCILVTSVAAFAQLRPLPPEMLGERLYAQVPMIGTGKNGDYVRPKYAPLPPPERRPSPGQTEAAPIVEDLDLLQPEEKTRKEKERFEARKRMIGAFSYVLSDDRKSAIVEFVASDEAAFAEILKDPEVKVFKKREFLSSAAKKDEAEAEFKKVKKNFDWSMLRTAGY